MTIASFFPGHIRIRDRVMKDPDIARAVQDFGKEQSYVTNIQINPVNGSILIEYEPERVPLDQFKAMARLLLHLKRLCDLYSPRKKEAIIETIHEIGKQLKDPDCGTT